MEINPLKVGYFSLLMFTYSFDSSHHEELRRADTLSQVYEQMIQQIEEDTGSLPPSLPRGVPPETAAANSDVQAIIVPRLTMLMEIANTFLSTIIDSMETVPYGIRWICKQIRSLTRVRSKHQKDRTRVAD